MNLKVEKVVSHKVPTGVLGLSSSHQKKEILLSCMDGGVYKFNFEDEALTKVAQHLSYASGVVEVSDRTIVSAGYDGVIKWTEVLDNPGSQDVQAHSFWSWQLKLSKDKSLIASASGQYLCGGYKYEPAPEKEPSIRVYDSKTRELKHSFSLTPPVLSLAFDPNGKFLSAANLMGDIKIWNLQDGKLHASWNTPDFTSWGIIKSHHYIGGIFDQSFSPDGEKLVVCGMGPMRDPMAGNGKQTWHMYDVLHSSESPEKTLEVKDNQRGRGLMEALTFHPSGKFFVMAGRLAQGQWNIGIFDSISGELLHSINNKWRVTSLGFDDDGNHLIVGGARSQDGKKDGKWRDFGALEVYTIKAS